MLWINEDGNPGADIATVTASRAYLGAARESWRPIQIEVDAAGGSCAFDPVGLPSEISHAESSSLVSRARSTSQAG